MLSAAKYEVFVQYAAQEAYSNLDLAEAVRLYCSDFKTISDAPDNNLTNSAIANSLTSPINLARIFDAAAINVKNNAGQLMAPEMRKSTMVNGFHTVFWNIVSNVIFIVLSVLLYIAIQSTYKDVLTNIEPTKIENADTSSTESSTPTVTDLNPDFIEPEKP